MPAVTKPGKVEEKTYSILIIEDERKLARSLQRQLEREGFHVEIVEDGLAGERRLREKEFSMAILDLTLPGKMGMDILRDLRADENTTPVLILSAQGRVDERVKGLALGADDYLVKPFDAAELLARVQAILRRTHELPRGILTAGDLRMDTRHNLVTRAGSPIHLSPREYALLHYLLRNKNRIVSRRQIIEQVWGYTFDTGTNIVDVYVSYLRKSVDEGYGEKLILTVHGQGFVLRDV